MSKNTPEGLGKAGLAVWHSIAGRYELRADEKHRLESACKTADMIDALERGWIAAGSPHITKGSMGQEVIHPAIGEMRAQRAALERMLAALKLPDEAPAAEDNVSSAARAAAASRWTRGA
ncbi:hypothetical protein GCM10027053_51880 [Intrasporangium mesophilum]